MLYSIFKILVLNGANGIISFIFLKVSYYHCLKVQIIWTKKTKVVRFYQNVRWQTYRLTDHLPRKRNMKRFDCAINWFWNCPNFFLKILCTCSKSKYLLFRKKNWKMKIKKGTNEIHCISNLTLEKIESLNYRNKLLEILSNLISND